MRRPILRQRPVLFLALALFAAAIVPTSGQFRLVSPIEPLPAGGWRVTWQSTPGFRYLLQRWDGDTTGSPPVPDWVTVNTLIASAGLTSAEDPTSAGVKVRFYRVVRLSGAGDSVPPVVSELGIERLVASGQEILRVSVDATDNLGVASVTFLNGSTVLGTGVAFANRWSLNLPITNSSLTTLNLLAQASDAAGNLAYSPIKTVAIGTAARFAPLDANGDPLPGGTITSTLNGTLAPFELRAGASVSGGLAVKFPGGGQLKQVAGREVIEFHEAEFRFGAGSALQFVASPTNAPAGVVRVNSAAARQLPTASLTADDLAAAMGLPAGAGIPVILFGQFPLQWHGGIWDNDGIRNPQFGFSGLPLPLRSARYRDYRISLDNVRRVALPYHGAFTLTDGTATPPQIRTSPEDPAWVTFKADGTVAYRNRSEIQLPGGGRFRADINLDAPLYQIKVFADSVHVPMIGSLADLLPTNAAVCIPPNGYTSSDLATATRCLNRFAAACCNFAASAAAAAPIPANAETNSLPSPPDDAETISSVLEAWAFSALTPVAFALPFDSLAELFRQSGESAAAAPDLESVLRYRLALIRARAAVAGGTVSLSPAGLAELEAALAEAETAALLRARDPGALASLASLKEVLSLLTQTREVFQEAGLPDSPALAEAMEDLLRDFLETYLQQLGVQPGQFTSAANPRIAEMNRFTAYQSVDDLLVLLGEAAAPGIDGRISAPINEALSQLALRLFAVAGAALDSAEALGDVPAFNQSLADILDLLAWRQLAVFPNVPALSGLPTTADVPGYIARLEVILLADLARPYAERSLVSQAAEIRRLLRILRDVPPGVTLDSALIQQPFDRLSAALADARSRLAAITSCVELLELLEAGILHEQLRVRFALAAPHNWESTLLPEFVQRLAAVGAAQNEWSCLHRGFEMLVAEANRFAGLNDLNHRFRYLEQCPPLLAAARAAARAVWQSAESRRADNPALFVTDLLLPGDIHVDKVAGGFTYRADTGRFSGSFKGHLGLPKFAARLNIKSASFSSAGKFDLTASGTLGLPLSHPVHALSIPDRNPLHIRFEAPDDLRFSGGLNLTLQNGLQFGGVLGWEKPNYRFGMSMEGLRLDLTDKVTAYRPVFNGTEVFSAEAATVLSEYFRSLNASFEPLAALTAPLDVGDAGAPPDFQAPAYTMEFDALEAWANSVLADAARGVNRSYASTHDTVRSLASNAADHLEESRTHLQSLVGALDQRALELQRMTNAHRVLGKLGRAVETRVAAGESGALTELGQSPEVQKLLRQSRSNVVELLAEPSGNQARDWEVATSVLEVMAAEQTFEQPVTSASELVDFTQRSQAGYLSKLGYDPSTGAVTNAAALDALTIRQLDEALVQVTDFPAQLAFIGQPAAPTAYAAIRLDLAVRLRNKTIDRLRELPASQWKEREALLGILEQLNAGHVNGIIMWPAEVKQLDGSQGPFQPTAESLELQALAEEAYSIRSEDLRRRAEEDAFAAKNPLRGLLLRLRRASGQGFSAKVNAQIHHDITNALARLDAYALEEWPRERLRDGVEALDALLEVSAAIEELNLPAELVRARDVVLPNLTLQFTEVAEANKAWWLLSACTEKLVEASTRRVNGYPTALSNACLTAASRSVHAANRITEAFVLLRPAWEPVDLKLPGDLRVRRLFGNVFYNSETEVLSGLFGGRLEFPGLDNAFFEITAASISTDGSFILNGATGGPLQFGDLRLNSSISLVGNTAGTLTASGAGQLIVPLNLSTQIYNAALSYSSPQRRLSFDIGAQNIDLPLTDHFVLFNGGVGIDLDALHPSGALRFSGSAGLFARQTPHREPIAHTNFHLVVTNAALTLAMSANGFSASLTNGTLLLPEYFQTSLCATNATLTNFVRSKFGTNSVLTNFVSGATTNPPPGSVGPRISLNPTNPITVAYTADPQLLSFSGELRFREIGLRIPEWDALELAICQANLVFPTNQFPMLTNLYAALQFPLPGQTSIVEVVEGAWGIDGLPTGTIRLRSNVEVYNEDGFRFTLLGTQSGLCPAGTGFTLDYDTNDLLFARLDGGFEFAVPADTLSDHEGGELTTSACGSLTVPLGGNPNFAINALSLGASSIRLGGTNGVTVTNALLQLSGLTNLFTQSAQNPFVVSLGGAVLLPGGAGLGLSNAMFRFAGSGFPQFSVAEVMLINPGAIFDLNEYLPLQIQEARFGFLNPTNPLPDLFYPENLRLVLTGSLSIPPGPDAVLAGRVKDLVVTWVDGRPHFSLDAVGITADPTEILGGEFPLVLGGDLYIGGLNDAPNFLFSGKLKGNFKGNAIEGVVALDMCGLRGICFGLAGAEVNIPIAYGIVLTGGRGGVSFVNSNEDPCDFLTYLPIDPVTGRPIGGSQCRIDPPACTTLLTMNDLLNRRGGGGPAATAATGGFTAASSGGAPAGGSQPNFFNCPEPGTCPPASVNILCMPHPDSGDGASPHANRVIVKFSSIDETALNAIGITPEFITGLVPQFNLDRAGVAMDIAYAIRQWVDALTPRAPPGAPDWVAAADALIAGKLDQMELGLANSLNCALQPLPSSGANLASLIYSAIRDTAYAGVLCPDETIKLEGSVSYLGVSSFASISGGVVISTTGSAGVIGSLNVFGIPFGRARAFVNGTDAMGNPALTVCGEVVAAIGPLELGTVGMLEDCPDCFTKLFQPFPALFAGLSDAYVLQIMNRVLPELANPAYNAAAHLNLILATDAQNTNDNAKLKFLAAMVAAPPVEVNGNYSGPFIDFLATIADAIAIRESMCAETHPKLFGLSLTGDNALSDYKGYAGPRNPTNTAEGFLFAQEYGMSPFHLFSTTLLNFTGVGSLASMFVPAIDEAYVAAAIELPSLGTLVRDSLTRPPPEFAAARTEDFLKRLRTTFNYRLAPLGMELGRAGGRILMPSLDHHPAGPNPLVPPEDRGQGLPDRLDVLLAALGDKDDTNAVNRLGDISWIGEGDAAFNEIFAGSPFASAVERKNLSLTDDYFPHGGFLGAGTLDFPAALTRPIPGSIATLLDTNASAPTRLAAAQDLVFNYLLATERVAEMSWYLPAPNPPVAVFPRSAQEMMDSLRGFDPSDALQFQAYYPIDQAFMSGWLDTPILGIPTVRSRISLDPAQGVFEMEASVPTNSWFNHLLGRAQFLVRMTSSTNAPDSITNSFAQLAAQVAVLTPSTPNLAGRIRTIATDLPQQLASYLPKFSAVLAVQQMKVPFPTYVPNRAMAPSLVLATINNASVEAYSPYFNQPGARGNNPIDRARREGGFGIRGDFNFNNGMISIPKAEFAVLPTITPLGLPAIAGQMAVNNVSLFGLSLGPITPAQAQQLGVSSNQALVQFSADDNAASLRAYGSVSSVNLGPIFNLASPDGSSRIGVHVDFATTTSTLPAGGIWISPCRLQSALIAAGNTLLVHGATTNDAFQINSAGPWTAAVTMPAGQTPELVIGGETVLRLRRPAAAANQPFRAMLSGNGTTFTGLGFTNLALGTIIDTYPNAAVSDPRRQSFTIGLNGTISLAIDGEGQFSLNAVVQAPFLVSNRPMSQLNAGFNLAMNNTSFTLTGTASGGLLATYGVSAQATLSLTAGGINVSGTVNIGPLDYGIFHLASTVNGPIAVTFSNTGLQVPSGARLTFTSLSASSLALAAFVINNDGTFTISVAGTLVWDGRSLGFLIASLVRTPAGVTMLTANVNLSPIAIGSYATLRPKTGSTIAATLQAASDGTYTYSMIPARLDLAGVGSTVQMEIYGANTNAPFTFSTTAPWNATVAAASVTIDPPGTTPALLQVAPSSGTGNLFSAVLTGNGTTSVTFTGTRTGNVAATLFPGSAMERAYASINPGTMTLTQGVGVFDLTFDPPDLAYGNAFRLDSGSIEVHATTTTGSVNLVAPTLRLLPGNFLERSLSLSSAALSPSSFVLNLDGKTLNFPQLPGLTLTGNMTLTSTGFSMSSFSTGGRSYGGQPLGGGGSTPVLVSFGSSASGNSLAFDGTTLSLVANNPNATILGLSLATSDLAAITFSVGLNGAFNAAFAVQNDENLFGSGIVKLRSGNFNLAGTITALDGNFTLNAGARVVLVHPNPANLSATVSHTNNFSISVAQGQNFTATLTASLPTFDLGWLRIDPGGAGEIAFTRNATTGAMGLTFDGWDIYLFGVKFDNVGFIFNSSGLLSRNVGTANFDFGSGNYMLRLATSASTPVSWNGLTGAIAVNLPTSAELQSPNIPAITGTLINGIDLPSNFPALTARGTFTNTWSHSFVINNLNFGTQSIRLWREAVNGNLRVEVTGNNALGLTGLRHRTYLSTAGNFESELTQSFSIGSNPRYHLATVNLSLNIGDPTYQFQGTADITDLDINVFTPDASLKIGSGGVAFFGSLFPLP